MSQDDGMTAWGQGNKSAYIFGTSEGLDAFKVVRFHAVEEISQPYEYEITLQRDADASAVEIEGLVDTAASLWITTGDHGRVVHGIIAEAEELDRTRSLVFFRVLLVPPIWAAKYRRRCRNFVDWTLRQIVEAVLMNVSPESGDVAGGLNEHSGDVSAPSDGPGAGEFKAPVGKFRWAVIDPARLDDEKLYPYVVQYNESDFDFCSRLLEREGLSYYFEHTDDASIMTLSDEPGQWPPVKDDGRISLKRIAESGQGSEKQYVTNYRRASRMRSRAATVREYDWRRSQNQFEATWSARNGEPETLGAFEFPAGDEIAKDDPCGHAALIRLDRFQVEAAMREGSGNVRMLVPGYAYNLTDEDGLGADEDFVIVRVETFATELSPPVASLEREPFGFDAQAGSRGTTYENRFLACPGSLTFRPAMRTPAPRIHGIQTAVVTAEERSKDDRPEVNADKYGCVRVRFPWDQRPDKDDGTPTSCWIRVSHYWAGSAFGALYTPRVGHEVLVACREGNPEQPYVVGRVYNVQTPPPYDPEQYPARSTVKSHSSPKAEGHNELRFEDTATLEEVYLHAQRDLNEVVRASHSTSVGGDQSNSVGGNQTNSVKGHREHTIADYETVTVGSDRTTQIMANEHHSVQGSRDTTILANDDLVVNGSRKADVSAGDALTVKGKRDVVVMADYTEKTSGKYTNEAGAQIRAQSVYVLVNGKVVTSVHGGVSLYLHGGCSVHITAGSTVNVSAPTVNVGGDSEVNVSGGTVNVNGPTNITGFPIKLNC